MYKSLDQVMVQRLALGIKEGLAISSIQCVGHDALTAIFPELGDRLLYQYYQDEGADSFYVYASECKFNEQSDGSELPVKLPSVPLKWLDREDTKRLRQELRVLDMEGKWRGKYRVVADV